MGLLRFLLAMTVVYSHTYEDVPHRIFSQEVRFNFGAAAVVLFYMISGYFMEKKLTRNLAAFAPERRKLVFYLDRIWRIYPTYCLCYAFSLPYLLRLLGLSVSQAPMGFLLLNLLVIPTGFYYALPQTMLQDHLVIAPSPSLAVEEMFFLCFPFINRRANFFILCSVACYAASLLGLVNAYYVSYMGLPGTLFLFLTGAKISGGAKADRAILLAMGVCFFAAFCLLLRPRSQIPHLLEVALAYPLGVAMLLAHFRTDWSVLPRRFAAISKFLGTLSYPIFLLHWIAVDLSMNMDGGRTAPLLAVAFSLPVYFFERVIQDRRRLYMRSDA